LSFKWPDGPSGSRQIVGRSKKRGFHWHYGVSCRARIAPPRHVRIAGRVIFTSDGHSPLGDRDHRAPVEVLDAYRSVPSRMKNVEVHIFPGVLHGYMMRGCPKAFHPVTRVFSMARALAILDGLRGGRVSQSLHHAS